MPEEKQVLAAETRNKVQARQFRRAHRTAKSEPLLTKATQRARRIQQGYRAPGDLIYLVHTTGITDTPGPTHDDSGTQWSCDNKIKNKCHDVGSTEYGVPTARITDTNYRLK